MKWDEISKNTKLQVLFRNTTWGKYCSSKWIGRRNRIPGQTVHLKNEFTCCKHRLQMSGSNAVTDFAV